MTQAVPQYRWPQAPGRIPPWIYTDAKIAELEQTRIFQGPAWNYVALEAEVPKVGDYVRSYVGSVPVVVSRSSADEISVFENRCAHRGVEFCRSFKGNTSVFVCPYHQWSYDSSGKLKTVPFRRGVRGQGGMPEDFRMEEHHPTQLRVARRGGVIFASFSNSVEPLDEYLGPEILMAFDEIFNGRELSVLGRHRNTIPANWKLYQENLKDPYHATLLHTYFATFGLFVAGNKTSFLFDASGRHHAQMTRKPAERPKSDENTAEIRTFKEQMALNDPTVLTYMQDIETDWTGVAITVWPNFAVIRNMNILQARQIVPRGPNECLINWTVFGFAEDTDELRRHRLRQNNIFGPAGYVGVDDHEALRFLQDGLKDAAPRDGLVLLGSDERATDNPITEGAVRALYDHYRRAMDL